MPGVQGCVLETVQDGPAGRDALAEEGRGASPYQVGSCQARQHIAAVGQHGLSLGGEVNRTAAGGAELRLAVAP